MNVFLRLFTVRHDDISDKQEAIKPGWQVISIRPDVSNDIEIHMQAHTALRFLFVQCDWLVDIQPTPGPTSYR